MSDPIKETAEAALKNAAKKPARTIAGVAAAGLLAWNAKEIASICGGMVGFYYQNILGTAAEFVLNKAVELYGQRQKIQRAAKLSAMHLFFWLFVTAGVGSLGNLCTGTLREIVRGAAFIPGVLLWANAFATGGVLLAQVLVAAYAVTATAEVAQQPPVWLAGIVRGILVKEGAIAEDKAIGGWKIVDTEKWRTVVVGLAGKAFWLILSLIVFVTFTRSLTVLVGLLLLYMMAVTMYTVATEQGWSVSWGPKIVYNAIRLCMVLTLLSLPLKFTMPNTVQYAAEHISAADNRMLATLKYGDFGPISAWEPVATGEWEIHSKGEMLFDGTEVTDEMLKPVPAKDATTEQVTAPVSAKKMSIASRILLAACLAFMWLFAIFVVVYLKIAIFSHKPKRTEHAARLEEIEEAGEVRDAERKILGIESSPTVATTEIVVTRGSSFWRIVGAVVVASLLLSLVGYGIAAATGNIGQVAPAPTTTVVVAPPPAPPSTVTVVVPAATAKAAANASPKKTGNAGAKIADEIDARW